MKNHLLLFIVTTAIAIISYTTNAQQCPPRLEKPIYTFPRTNSQHLDLSSDWELTALDDTISELSALKGSEWMKVDKPTTIQMAWFKASKLPDPYFGMNSDLYHKLEQMAHYYRKTFLTPKMSEGNFAILSFEGVDYSIRIWINGKCVGDHDGMYGGPTVDVTEYLNKDNTPNELIAEVRSANFRNPDFHPHRTGKVIRPWNFSNCRDAQLPFFHMGMWNDVRIDVFPKYNIEQPYFRTISLSDDKAVIRFEVEMLSGKWSGDYLFHVWHNESLGNKQVYTCSPVKDDVKVSVTFRDDEGKVAFSNMYSPVVMSGRCWMDEEMIINNPKIWYPNGLGEHPLYNVSIEMYVNGKSSDKIEFNYGIRKIDNIKSAGPRVQERFVDWQFVVNGDKTFIKGINWMPLDILGNTTPETYEWAVGMARDMGVQMIRVWGSGYLEKNIFYDLCDKYGIMVWQDFPQANSDNPEWSQPVWEAQVCRNILRLRNRASLVVWCGGNEFNPYSIGNTANMGIVERNLAELDPSRLFMRATPYGGSTHKYGIIDPCFYSRISAVTFMAEGGIHNMDSADHIRKVISSEELVDISTLMSPDFKSKHPEITNHFCEFVPWRAGDMVARGSHIEDVKGAELENFVEAAQYGAAEFYQIMSDALQSEYPNITGLIPWTFKYSWAPVGTIMIIDGFGQPTPAYYFLKRTYEDTHVSIDLPRLLYARGEKVDLRASVMNAPGRPSFKGKIEVTVADSTFKTLESFSVPVDVTPGLSMNKADIGSFTFSKEKFGFYFITAVLRDGDGKIVSRSTYWPRTIAKMDDDDFYAKFVEPNANVESSVAWPELNDGPWLKPVITKCKTKLVVSNVSKNENGTYSLTISNKGKYPSLITRIDIKECISVCDDNFFRLDPGESRKVMVKIKDGSIENGEKLRAEVSSWNSKMEIIPLSKL